jgi:hypothetical protein
MPTVKLTKTKDGIVRILGDNLHSKGVSAKLDSEGNVFGGVTEEDRNYISFVGDGLKCKKLWKGWLPTHKWINREGDVVQFSRRSIIDLISLLPNAQSPVEDFNFCFGPAVEGDTTELETIGRYTERLYVVYMSDDGSYYLAKSNANFDGWDYYNRLVFVPTGAYNPSISFDESGHFVVAAEFKPADGEVELWIYQYPYVGEAIRAIVRGDIYRTPFLFLDPEKDLLYFYGDNNNIRYRAKSQNYNTQHSLPISTPGYINIKTIRWFTSDDKYYGIIVAYKLDNETFLRYIVTIGIRSEVFSEYIDANTSLLGIAWESMLEIEEFFEEYISASTSLLNIMWQEILEIELTFGESSSTSTDLRNITWVEITLLNQDFDESVSAQTSLLSILWVQVLQILYPSNGLYPGDTLYPLGEEL